VWRHASTQSRWSSSTRSRHGPDGPPIACPGRVTRRRPASRSRGKRTLGRPSAARSGAARAHAGGARGRRRRPEPAVAPSRSRLRWLRFAIPAALLVGLVRFYQLYRSASPSTGPIYLPSLTVSDPSSLPGIQTGQPPWNAGTGGLRDRLRALGLPALGSEGTALHTHEHLDVFVHGRPVTVPADIGIDRTGGFISPLHTHDPSGVIH